MPRLEPESTISHYKIKELIAIGGMGEVYRAIDLQLGRVVALKTILSVKADDPDAYRRFLREARSASILSHPSICTIYEIGKEGDLTFIAMQHIRGRTLQNILSVEQLTIETALSYALDIAEALDEAHHKGVIHRDIKPSNIIANERDIAVVLDFGLAKQVSFAETLNEELPTLVQLTSAGMMLGTAPYMPPEEIRGESLDERSDIFSFGVTLYEMLSGIRPFDRPNKVDILHAILHYEPKPITELRADVDARLDAIVARALTKNRSERYQSVSELKQEIVTYIQETGYRVRGVPSTSASRKLTPVSPNGLEKLSTKIGSTSSSAFFTSVALAFLILVVLTGAIWWLSVNRGSEALPILRHIQLVNWKSEPGEYTSDAVFSRDGRMIAFSSIRGGRNDIWIKQATMGDPNQITKGEWNSWNPVWSADNQQLGFVSRRGGQAGIWRMPTLGGAPTMIGGPVNGSVRLNYWSKDSETIYYDLYSNLFAVNVPSGQTTQLTKFEPSEHFPNLSFSISPKEDRIAYIDRKDGQSDVWVMLIRGGPPVRVTNDTAEDKNPVWHPDGKRVIYSSVRDGTYQICVAYLDGRQPLQITSGEVDKFVLDVASDGSKILYSASKEESDLWAVRTDSGQETEVTSAPGVELWPDVSPNGRIIAYQAISDPGQGAKLAKSLVMIKPVETQGQQTQVAIDGIDPTWSPDGTRLAFLRSSVGTWNIWTVRSTSGDEKQVTRHDCRASYSVLPYHLIEARPYSWSPDGSKIIFASETAAKYSVWVVAADGSSETEIAGNSDLFLYCPLWTPDSSGVAYVSQARVTPANETNSWSVWLADANTKKSEPIFQADSVLRLLGWSGSGNDLLIATIEGQRIISGKAADVSLISVAKPGGNTQPIANLRSAYLNNIQLSPDGQTIAFSSHQDGKDNIWLIPAKGGEARKITSNMDPRLYFSSMAFSPDGKTIYFGKQSRSSLVSMIDNFK